MHNTSSPSTSTFRSAAHELTSHAVDEAFADLPELLARIDAAESPAAKRNYVAETERLVARIGEQMRAIEAQRGRLAKMLGDLNIACDI